MFKCDVNILTKTFPNNGSEVFYASDFSIMYEQMPDHLLERKTQTMVLMPMACISTIYGYYFYHGYQVYIICYAAT